VGHAPSPWGNGPATSDSCVDLIKECKYTGSVTLSKHCSVCLSHPKMSNIPGDSYHPFSCMAVTRLTCATLELRNMLSSVLHTTYSLWKSPGTQHTRKIFIRCVSSSISREKVTNLYHQHSTEWKTWRAASLSRESKHL